MTASAKGPPVRAGELRPERSRWSPRGYVTGVMAVAATAALCAVVRPYLQLTDLVMINLVSVVLVSMRFGLGPSLVTAGLSALTFDFFFIPPVFSFAPEDLKGVVTLIVMIVVAAVISGLGERTRRQNLAAQHREVQIEAERLRNSLLSAVSHDLRTPLAAIVGAGTELLQDGAALPPAARDGLAEAIVEEAARLDRLVTNLLEVARLDGGSIEIRKRPEPLDEIVEVSLSRVHGRLGSRAIRTHVPQEVPMVPVDGVLIQHVLVNLLENALRYAPEPSPIDIEVSRGSTNVLLKVRDHGPGVDEEEAPRLFERFYRGRSGVARDGGAGLGLTICRAIVEAHGGTISIGNHAEGGALVEVSLPLGEPTRVLS